MVDIAINDVARRIQYSGNTGLGPFQFTFNILNQADIAAYKNSTALTLTADYTVIVNANGTGSITLTGTGNGTAVILADVITIVGDVALSRVTDFTQGGDFQTAAVNEQFDSMIVMLQQLDEKIGRSVKGPVQDTITGFTLPTDRKGKVLAFDATTGAPTNGPTVSAVNSAEANAIAAAASATSAAASAASAASSYDSFDDRYLGPYSSNPTLDNDGNTLLIGALYFNTVANDMRVWTGSAWATAYANLSSALLTANNLSDVNSKGAAFANLMGYTTIATAAGTTVLTNASTQYQLFTGATTQTITLPVTSTLGTGWTFRIVNNSTGNLTVNSSGGNLVATVIPQTTARINCIGTALTTAADWEVGFTDFGSVTGTGSAVLAVSPALTGTPTAPTATALTNTTQLATTAFVTTADNLKANLASPTFTGTPLAPTASVATNTTQIATTAFVLANTGGMTLLGTLTTTSGTTQTLSSLILTSYKQLFITVSGVSFTALVTLLLDSKVIGSALTLATEYFEGFVTIDLTTGTMAAALSNKQSGGSANQVTGYAYTSTITTASTSISFTGGTFDAGTIRVYGVK